MELVAPAVSVRSWVASSAAVSSLVVLVGCAGAGGSGEATPFDTELNEAGDVSTDVAGLGADGQESVLADGEVTVEEYQSAFASFARCAEERGGYVAEVQRNPRSGEILYETGGKLLDPGESGSSVENDCYQEHFAEIEVVFATTNSAALSEAEQHDWDYWYYAFVPCLELLGVEYPDEIVMYSPEYMEISQVAIDAFISGDCPNPDF